MSWGEVFKINKNMKRALNEQLRDLKFQPIRIITTTTTYTPEKTGLYKVICVGAGGNGGYSNSVGSVGAGSGGGGGVAIKTIKLDSDTSYSVTVSATASFAYNSEAITATAGGYGLSNVAGAGGTASGGDYNYTGESGSNTGTISTGTSHVPPATGSVGVFISDLTRSPSPDYADSKIFPYGDSLLNYGGGGTAYGYYNGSGSYGGYASVGKPAAVIIIPIEMEE